MYKKVLDVKNNIYSHNLFDSDKMLKDISDYDETIHEFTGNNFFLSNFYYCKYPLNFLSNGIEYKSNYAECIYQAMKIDIEYKFDMSIGDREIEIKKVIKTILNSKPSEAKQKLKTLLNDNHDFNNFRIKKNWDNIEFSIMMNILRIKFSDDNVFLKEKLIATGTKELINANNWKDDYWGVYNGNGKNMLGKILMKIRDDLKERKEYLSKAYVSTD